MVVGKAKDGAMKKFAGQDGHKASCDNSSPSVEHLLANEIDRNDCQGTQNSGKIYTDNVYSMLTWRTQANKPNNTSKKPAEEGRPDYGITVGIEGIRVKNNMLGEMVKQIVYQSHMVVGIDAGKLYPVASEDVVIGEENSKI